MKIEPVKCYRAPKYATYEYLLEHPELLKKVPVRWRSNKLVIAAACTFAMLINGCDKSDPVQGAGGMRLPPMITEIEAQTIIRDEAAKAGLSFISDSLTIDSIRIPIHRYYYPDTCTTDTVRFTPPTHFTFDGHDTLHHISYEYLSQEDLYGWRNLDSTLMNFWSDELKTTRDLQNQLRNQYPELHPGVFNESYNEFELRQQVHDFIKWLATEGVI